VAKFSGLFPWLRTLYPPAEARGFQPSEISEDVSLVHEVHVGTDFLGTALSQALSATAPILFIESDVVPVGFFRYVIAFSGLHNDPTARDITLSISGTSIWAAESALSWTRNVHLATPRAFIVPTHQRLRVEVNALATAQTVSLRMLYFDIALGLPAVPSP